MTLKLHCFGESGNSYKAALTLELAGLRLGTRFCRFLSWRRADRRLSKPKYYGRSSGAGAG